MAKKDEEYREGRHDGSGKDDLFEAIQSNSSPWPELEVKVVTVGSPRWAPIMTFLVHMIVGTLIMCMLLGVALLMRLVGSYIGLQGFASSFLSFGYTALIAVDIILFIIFIFRISWAFINDILGSTFNIRSTSEP